MDFPKTVPGVNLDVNDEFTGGDPSQGIPASIDPPEWNNAVTKEILNVIQAGGLTPDEAKFDQLQLAILAQIQSALGGHNHDSDYLAITDAFGAGQSWQDVLSSRVSGVTYTNSTGKPIALALDYFGYSGAGSVTVDGVVVALMNGESGSTEIQSIGAIIVPDGSGYVVNFGSQSVTRWVELR